MGYGVGVDDTGSKVHIAVISPSFGSTFYRYVFLGCLTQNEIDLGMLIGHDFNLQENCNITRAWPLNYYSDTVLKHLLHDHSIVPEANCRKGNCRNNKLCYLVSVWPVTSKCMLIWYEPLFMVYNASLHIVAQDVPVADIFSHVLHIKQNHYHVSAL